MDVEQMKKKELAAFTKIVVGLGLLLLLVVGATYLIPEFL